MFDLNSLPVSGGVIVAGTVWAAIAGFALGPVVAERTIENSGWQLTCEADLRRSAAERVPQIQSRPTIACSDIMSAFGNGADQLCKQGGNAIFDLLTIDPLAGQKQQLRRQETARLDRIANLAPSRCSCAASLVGANRLVWGLYAGSARLIGGPQDLHSDLTRALHGPACAQLGRYER